MKPVCVKCQRFYHIERNGTPFVEAYPDANSAPSGTAAPERWKPYKLWLGDLYVCEGCGSEIIVGTGQQHIAEHYQSDFAAKVASHGATIQVNDC